MSQRALFAVLFAGLLVACEDDTLLDHNAVSQTKYGLLAGAEYALLTADQADTLAARLAVFAEPFSPILLTFSPIPSTQPKSCSPSTPTTPDSPYPRPPPTLTTSLEMAVKMPFTKPALLSALPPLSSPPIKHTKLLAVPLLPLSKPMPPLMTLAMLA